MITQTATNSFAQDLLLGIHDFSNDIFYLSLYGPTANIGAETPAYTSAGETVGSGYMAGGLPLTGVSVSSVDGIAFVGFNNATWSPAAFTARGALIYNLSKSSRSVAVLNFGDDKTSTNTFTVQMPPATATSALIRISKGA
jgi:hypothetical protein